MSIWFQFFVLFVLVCLSAFFSGVETALMSLNKIKVKSLLKQKRKGSLALSRIKENPSKLIITILIGNNLVNIGAASFATVVFTTLFGSSGLGIATGIMTFLILIFGEITPKTYAAENSVKISLKVARSIELISILLTPIVFIFEKISLGMRKILKSTGDGSMSEEELRTIVTMGRAEGLLDKEEAEMMHNILEFRGTKVVEVMATREDIEMIDGEKRIEEILDFVVKSPFSRYPIYLGEDKDNIIGYLDVDDVLRMVHKRKTKQKVKTIAKKILFVPESREIDDLLEEFEEKDIRLALVVDEYENILGLVSIVDILEEIVGDIFDKSKRRSSHVKKFNKTEIKANAKISIDEVNRIFRLKMKSDRFNTIAGLIQHKLKRMPKAGERVRLKRIIIEVEKVTNKGISQVKIIKI